MTRFLLAGCGAAVLWAQAPVHLPKTATEVRVEPGLILTIETNAQASEQIAVRDEQGTLILGPLTPAPDDPAVRHVVVAGLARWGPNRIAVSVLLKLKMDEGVYGLALLRLDRPEAKPVFRETGDYWCESLAEGPDGSLWCAGHLIGAGRKDYGLLRRFDRGLNVISEEIPRNQFDGVPHPRLAPGPGGSAAFWLPSHLTVCRALAGRAAACRNDLPVSTEGRPLPSVVLAPDGAMLALLPEAKGVEALSTPYAVYSVARNDVWTKLTGWPEQRRGVVLAGSGQRGVAFWDRTARILSFLPYPPPPEAPKPVEGDVMLRDFRFASGETLPQLRLHYRTLGTPQKDNQGRVNNAVLILHGTTGSGAAFLNASYFQGELFGPGQPLDAGRYYLIMPDGIGHGQSSKPSDGLKMRFPKYGYRDMVEAQRLMIRALGVERLKLILGTSMGCMHAWIWGTEYPDEAEALMPLACLPYPITGRNLLWRQLSIDLIRHDPNYRGGDYQQPLAAMEGVRGIMTLMTQNTLDLQARGGTREAALEVYRRTTAGRNIGDPNDVLYALDASRDYDPAPKLERVKARVTAINFADDPINPPELGILEREIRRVTKGKALVLPATPETHGHGNHTWAKYWTKELSELLDGRAATPPVR